ncbi:MAG: ribonuclease P [Candidatus Aenigmarchaeota archaeon CG_4_10_14_0_8_um_filter_37_24]|nr:ribonuclease P [Candidatus Aenigmarchaeota archaeon]OIN88516.1 MAG: hypothetical protein AUJ50_00560 [Candidatus Aenigmarchaeota archaeon CG1_02_38_14]PIV68855.1 MAG: ribonuclease P [Candidatus Aenigmarchaeota archaeon CG01_land_8_20_14_3_00_37_9]PIW41098.1 MAG: ribonuclease P [Candidatus Aenigmarchaeota archaeon CG15_BIG_FIL_POST_REV_8_21_14_020_37_27]PIX50947.1 MAG: ribonuclease P [Candidatus Aenigmarchaeota archaeon CG_4_8_14_3_um_filter_37_24]PIY35733.1 MAG: ribonuclease P [Candidatus A
MQRKKFKKPDWQLEIARERIEILFNLAKKGLEKHPKRSRRYVELARKISLRYNIRLPKEVKRGFCRKCSILYIRENCEEIDSKLPNIKMIKCLNCGEIKKIPK